MEEFEEFMAEMLEEYNYDKDTVMVTTAFAQALASEWEKKLLIQRVSNQRELLKAFLQYVNCSDTDSKVSFDLLDKYLNSL